MSKAARATRRDPAWLWGTPDESSPPVLVEQLGHE
jgi:hypothetical protein